MYLETFGRVNNRAVRADCRFAEEIKEAPEARAARRVRVRNDIIPKATNIILNDLQKSLEKEIMQKIMAEHIRGLIGGKRRELESRYKETGDELIETEVSHTPEVSDSQARDHLSDTGMVNGAVPQAEPMAVDGPKTIQEHDGVPNPDALANDEGHDIHVETSEVLDMPRKKRRKVKASTTRDDLESEDEATEELAEELNATEREKHDMAQAPVTTGIPNKSKDLESSSVLPKPAAEEESVQNKRPASPIADAPPRKRSKANTTEVANEPLPKAKGKKTSTKKQEKEKVTKPRKKGKISPESPALDTLVIPPMDVDTPAVTEIHISPRLEKKQSPALNKTFLEKSRPAPPRIEPLSPAAIREVFEDDEDAFFAKLALSQDVNHSNFVAHKEEESSNNLPSCWAQPEWEHPVSESDDANKHSTGSARAEGYYKISHKEKSAYVDQYASQTKAIERERAEAAPSPAPQQVSSSRSNRANARRRAAGLEEMNQLQLAVALSKGEAGATEVMKFNQLQTRKKHLRFARSPIHDWGLYAMERIGRGEMVIEYVGEVIRAAVADRRERTYERQGIGSSYLFRIDEDLVVDATKKGNLGYV